MEGTEAARGRGRSDISPAVEPARERGRSDIIPAVEPGASPARSAHTTATFSAPTLKLLQEANNEIVAYKSAICDGSMYPFSLHSFVLIGCLIDYMSHACAESPIPSPPPLSPLV
jgi:hypothetical protein